MEIKNKFNLKEEVYLVTDPDQELYLVTSIIVDIQGLMYTLRSSGKSVTVYDFEISNTKKY
jgi:hypothetical protein